MVQRFSLSACPLLTLAQARMADDPRRRCRPHRCSDDAPCVRLGASGEP